MSSYAQLSIDKWVKKVNKNFIWSVKGKTISLECPVMLNYRLVSKGDESVTSIDHYEEIYVNLHFDRSIFRPMCSHT